MTPEAGFVLKCRRDHGTGTVGCIDPNCTELGTTNGGQGEGGSLVGRMWIMAVDTSRVPIVVQYFTLVRVVLVLSCWERMSSRLGKLGENIGNHGRDVGTTAVAIDAILACLVHIWDGLIRSSQ